MTNTRLTATTLLANILSKQIAKLTMLEWMIYHSSPHIKIKASEELVDYLNLISSLDEQIVELKLQIAELKAQAVKDTNKT
jgi:hypothetical protein